MPELADYLSATLKNKDVAYRLKNALTDDLVVSGPKRRRIAQKVSEFLDEYGSLPKDGDWKVFLEEEVPDSERRAYARELGKLQDRDVSGYTPEYLAEKAVEDLQKQAAETAASRLYQEGENIEPEDIRRYQERVENIEPASLEGLVDLRDVEKWARPYKQEQGVKTGISKLDQKIGGFRDGDLIYILGDTNSGKSAFAINIGYKAALTGASVLEIALEDTKESICERFFRRVAKADQEMYRESIGEIRECGENYWDIAEGEYRLLERDPGDVTPSKIRSIVELHEQQYGEVDLLLIDYMDLMGADGSYNRQYQEIASISYDTKAVGREKGFPVVSPTQARRPEKKRYERLHLNDMGNAYAKNQAATCVLGWTRDKNQIENNEASVQILKQQEGRKGAVVNVYCNFDLMMIAGLDDNETRRVRRDYGDSPV